jgi:hypothetical protein
MHLILALKTTPCNVVAAVLEHPLETFLSQPEFRAILINIVDESTYRANMSGYMADQIEHLIQELESEI